MLVPMTTQPPSFTIAQALEEDLRKKGMTQEQLGTRLGVSQQAISGWIKDGHIPARRMSGLIELFGKDSMVAKVEQTRHDFRFAARRDEAAKRELVGAPEESLSVAENLPRRYVSHERIVGQAFTDALPSEFHANIERPIKLGWSSRRLDYLSDKVALELVVPAPLPNVWLPAKFAPAMMRLLVARQATLAEQPGRQYFLAVVLPAEAQMSNARQLQAIAADAELLGLVVLASNDPANLAKYVADIERGTGAWGEHDADVPDGPEDANPAYGKLLGGASKFDALGGEPDEVAK